MKSPLPDAAGRFARRFSPIRDAALRLGNHDKVVRLDLDVTYMTAVDVCQKAGIPIPRPVDTSLLSRCRAFRDACDAHLAREDSGRVLIARAAFDAIAEVEAAMSPRGPVVETSLDPATMFLLGKQLGQAISSINWLTSGVLEEYAKAANSVRKTGDSRRGVVPKWETNFLPVAVEYCSGKAKVTLADLHLLAKKWRDDERQAGRNPGLPGSPKGVLDGIKRMESSGRLKIPGRSPRK
jgi:hypothetical protein